MNARSSVHDTPSVKHLLHEDQARREWAGGPDNAIARIPRLQICAFKSG